MTCWERTEKSSPIVPFDISGNIRFLVVHVVDGRHEGQFVFDRKTLIEQGIMSRANSKGKLGFRVYPSWCKPQAPQAKRTQMWQLKHFHSIRKNVDELRDLAELLRATPKVSESKIALFGGDSSVSPEEKPAKLARLTQ